MYSVVVNTIQTLIRMFVRQCVFCTVSLAKILYTQDKGKLISHPRQCRGENLIRMRVSVVSQRLTTWYIADRYQSIFESWHGLHPYGHAVVAVTQRLALKKGEPIYGKTRH